MLFMKMQFYITSVVVDRKWVLSILPLSSCHRDLLPRNTGSVILLSSEGSISRVHSRQEVSSLRGMPCYMHRAKESSWQREQRDRIKSKEVREVK